MNSRGYIGLFGLYLKIQFLRKNFKILFGSNLLKKNSKITFSHLHINQSHFLSPLSFSITFSLTHIYSSTTKYQIIPNSQTLKQISKYTTKQIKKISKLSPKIFFENLSQNTNQTSSLSSKVGNYISSWVHNKNLILKLHCLNRKPYAKHLAKLPCYLTFWVAM